MHTTCRVSTSTSASTSLFVPSHSSCNDTNGSGTPTLMLKMKVSVVVVAAAAAIDLGTLFVEYGSGSGHYEDGANGSADHCQHQLTPLQGGSHHLQPGGEGYCYLILLLPGNTPYYVIFGIVKRGAIVLLVLV